MSTETIQASPQHFIGTTADLLSENLSATQAFSKDSVIGETVTGEVDSFEVRQTRDFDTKALETWDDGSPCRQIVVNLQTDLATGEDDDGMRSLYVKWWGASRRAFLRAVKDAGAADLEKGGILTATFTGEGEAPRKGMNPPKLYAFEYKRPGAIAQAEKK